MFLWYAASIRPYKMQCIQVQKAHQVLKEEWCPSDCHMDVLTPIGACCTSQIYWLAPRPKKRPHSSVQRIRFLCLFTTPWNSNLAVHTCLSLFSRTVLPRSPWLRNGPINRRGEKKMPSKITEKGDKNVLIYVTAYSAFLQWTLTFCWRTKAQLLKTKFLFRNGGCLTIFLLSFCGGGIKWLCNGFNLVVF